MKAFRPLLLLLCMLISIAVFSQKQHLQFEHIGTSMGLSQSNVMCIFQDSRGFMWFGTRDGLNKYDGYKFTIYKYDDKDSTSISHNTIQDIAEDRDGNLWIATWGGGLNMFDRNKEKFKRYYINTSTSWMNGTKLIDAIFFDSDGDLWIGTEGQGLQLYDRKDNKFIAFVHNENDSTSISDDIVKDIVEDSHHQLWVGTNSGGVCSFDKKTKKFKSFKHDPKSNKSISSNNVFRLFVDREDRLWLGTRDDGGLNLFDKSTQTFIHFKNDPKDINTIQSNVIRSIAEDELGHIWIGTENGGLSILDPRNMSIDNYLQDDVDNTGINNNSIWSIYKDKKGNMWVGTFSAGIDFINRDANKFVHYRHNSSALSLNNNSVLSILEDSKKNLWIGTDGGGLNLFNPLHGTFTHYKNDGTPNSVCGNYILKVIEDSDGNLWIGTWGDGVTVFNKEKNTFKHFKFDPAKPNGIGGNNIWTIAEDSDKNIWLGFYNSSNSVDMYDKKTARFIHYQNDPLNPNSLSNSTINSIFCDKEKNIWIATNGGGLDLFNKGTKTFTHFVNEENKNSISNNDVYCIAEDHQGNLWIGTNTGLNKLDKKTGRFSNYYMKDGLPSNTISGLLIDDSDILWISTFNGLSRFDFRKGLFKNFGINDGLQANEFKMNSCYKGHNGVLYFGGINGFNAFEPDGLKEKKYEAPLVFTDFQIFNKQIQVKDGSNPESPLTNDITDTKEIVLKHRQSVISFEFAYLNYGLNDKKKYSYRLEGFDKDWNYIDSKHTATYTNLDPGEYLFKVRALDNEGDWSSNVAMIRLTIKPPIWLTWWFKLIAFIVIAGSIVCIYVFRVRTIQSQKRKLQQKVDEQTAQLIQSARQEQKARQLAEFANEELGRKNKELEQFAYVASHDMQEPLRTTSSFVELLFQQYSGKLDEKADKYLNFIRQSSDRMKILINDLLDYSRIGVKKELTPVDCNEVIKEVLADIDVAIKEASAKIRTGSLPVINGYGSDIKQLFQNLVINAVKFRRKGIPPEIKIDACRKNGSWEFTCQDNGIGIDKQYQERIFVIFQRLHSRTEYDGSGIGLAHCKKIVEMHGGKIWLESQPQQGSTFYFTLPYTNIQMKNNK